VAVTVDGDSILPEKAVPFASGTAETPDQMAEVLSKALEDLRQGFNLVMVYNNGVDHEGHLHGPDSNHMKDMMSSLDAKIAAFLNELDADDVLGVSTDVVLLSDHGMTPNASMKLVSVTDLPQETRDKIDVAIGYTGHTQIRCFLV
jgi:predicted AlkP superfamily pyrophosphatase or phosphodiesterase